jgi:hypothetical protein
LPNLQKSKKIETRAVVEAMKGAERAVRPARRHGDEDPRQRQRRRQLGFAGGNLRRFASEGWWACLDSNQEPDRYERLKAVISRMKARIIVEF